MKATCFSLLCLILLLARCANLSNILQDTPVNSLTSDKAAKPFADCIAYASQESSLDSWNRFWDPARVTEIDGTYKVLVTLTGGLFIITSLPVAELTILPTDSGGSKSNIAPLQGGVAKRNFGNWSKNALVIRTNPGNKPG